MGACAGVVAGVAFLVTFLSASQDIVIDAYRREDLRDNELGLGSSLYVNGYRVGMLLAGSGGLILADHFSFAQVYLMMAATLLVGVVTTLLCREPALTRGTPRTFREAVVEPFTDYFQRDRALALLLFILLYKLGDQMASTMTTPFYLDLGFTKTEIGAVAKLFGFWSAIAGGLIGSLFGGTPRSGADVVWDVDKGTFAVANVSARKGGSKEAARSMAEAVAGGLNGIIASTGAKLVDAAGVEVSTGSACQAGVPRPSHVLLAMGYTEREARGAIRVSLGWSSSDADVDAFLGALPGVVERARRASQRAR